LERHASGIGKEDSVITTEVDKGNKVSFYFTNFPDFMPLVQLRQFFKVCSMLSDVYIEKKQNYRGQVYGFLRSFHSIFLHGGMPRCTHTFFKVIWFACVWVIWKDRNNCIFKNSVFTPLVLIEKIKLHLFL